MNPEPAPDDATRASPSAADRLARLVEEFRALPADSDRKREIIAELDDNAAAQPFLVSVVADAGEYDLARTEAATVLRLWPPAAPGLRHRAGRALLAALNDPEEDLVRQYAAMALGPYASDDPVVAEALIAAEGSEADPLVQACARSALEEAGLA
ncbi:hypothetical protein OG887_17870 [Streptomyces sp. NBC_00053]|uniref:hypothetical protein n=1 Tax=unclassified Streptomyces TaxID=2593676 RepID=UPI00224F7781|nr:MULTISPECIES: hypothetical protein [unclassified Streptomyces]MCX5101448.1 hypothetical protein [Streptomyces sp. NBC_00439]MCX5501235.1 hypothetical protein [Streptomyces sp. NBC_00052]MCX5550230.1 hypothetical protein [Streptomyces sp. NBC_00051]